MSSYPRVSGNLMLNLIPFIRENSARQLSLFAESAGAVNRVVLQHMSVNIMDNVIVKDNNCVSLSPPSESLMLQRRTSLQKGQSLQLNRLNNNTKVLSIQVVSK